MQARWDPADTIDGNAARRRAVRHAYNTLVERCSERARAGDVKCHPLPLSQDVL